jgi:hypothetical protein
MFSCDIYRRETGSFNMPGSLAIVTFYSDLIVQGKGFRMFYEAFANTTTEPIVAYSTNIILSETPDAYLTYPGDNSNYSNYELSTFVYSPDYSYDNSISIQADYVVNSLETSCDCCDSVTVYRFDFVFYADGIGRRRWDYVDK